MYGLRKQLSEVTETLLCAMDEKHENITQPPVFKGSEHISRFPKHNIRCACYLINISVDQNGILLSLYGPNLWLSCCVGSH